MKQRTGEAQRLEEDYIERVSKAALSLEPGDRNDVVQGVKDHIEEAVNELNESNVSLVQMAEVLERLGPPESYLGESEASRPESPAAGRPFPSAQEGLNSTVEGMDIPFLDGLLGGLWVAMLVGLVGLFIPIISLQFCAIISAILVMTHLKRSPERQPGAFRTAYTFTGIALILLIGMFAVGCLQFVHPAFAVLGLVFLAYPVIDYLAYWNIMEGLRIVCLKAGKDEVARSIGTKRLTCLFVYFAFFIVGLILVFSGASTKEVIATQLIMLPIWWLLGYFLVLRPISETRDALRGEAQF